MQGDRKRLDHSKEGNRQRMVELIHCVECSGEVLDQPLKQNDDVVKSEIINPEKPIDKDNEKRPI